MSRTSRDWRAVAPAVGLIGTMLDQEVEAGRIGRVSEQVLWASIDQALDVVDRVSSRLDQAAALMEWAQTT